MKSDLSSASKPAEPSVLPFIIREAAFFLAFFLVLWLRIRPELAFQRQEPVFLTGTDFFRGFLGRPGGTVEYLSAFFSQGLNHPALGAAIVTAFAWLAARLTYGLIRECSPVRRVRMFHLLPAVLLLGLHGHYSHPLSADIGLALLLLFTLGYARLRGGIFLRLAAFFVSGAVLYYIAAGWFLGYGLMCSLIETVRLRPLIGIPFAAFTAAVPAISRLFFLMDPEAAYLHLINFGAAYKPPVMPYLLAGFFPLMILLLHSWMSGRFKAMKRLRPKNPRLRFGMETAAILLFTGLAAWIPFERNNRLLLRVDREARLGQWDRLLRLSAREADPPLSVTFQTNRALFRKGLLLEDMFSFPQPFGVSGLLLPRRFSESAPLQESDFCYDIGSINESRHWAYDALSTLGESAWILRRLVEVNIVSGDLRAAEPCLNRLERAFFLRQDARRLRACLRDPALAGNDRTLSHGFAMLGRADYIAFNGHPRAELDSLLRDHPGNRMAFEYAAASDLLSMRLGNLASFAGKFQSLGYPRLPRHVEEALLQAWAMSGRREPLSEFKWIREATVRRFGEFNRVLMGYRGNPQAALPELYSRFGDTYWFYTVAHRTSRRIPAEPPSKAGGIQ